LRLRIRTTTLAGGMVVNRSDALALFGLGGRLDHHLLWPFGVHIARSVGIQLRLELVGVVEMICRFETPSRVSSSAFF
jgi:hypothetical protein